MVGGDSADNIGARNDHDGAPRKRSFFLWRDPLSACIGRIANETPDDALGKSGVFS